jgi:hypothetical protein
MNDKARHIKKKFPNQNNMIDCLLAEDPEFLDLCEDYNACVNALRYWSDSSDPEAETRVTEYRTLIRELEDDITHVIRINE